MKQPLLKTEHILYRGGDLLGINKPAGMPVHGSRILEDQPDTLLRMVRDKEGELVHAVHRLDRPVSGVILLTRSKHMLAQLSHEFEARRVKKCYIAVARGWPESSGMISHPLDQEFNAIVEAFEWGDALASWSEAKVEDRGREL